MMSCNQRRNGTKGTTNTSKRIDVDAIYAKMKDAISRRVEFQRQQDEVWARIKRGGYNGTNALDRIDKNIGAETHKLNVLLSELCQYHKTHKAMNLAYTYICKEVERARRTADANAATIRKVKAGQTCLVDSTGRRHCDTTRLEKYVRQKYEQVARLEKWKAHVARYSA